MNPFVVWKQWSGLCLGAMTFALLCSCGGGGSAMLPITRGNDSRFSTDAKALAARIADGPWLSADKAAMFDADLAQIRAQYPQVKDIHTVGDYTLNDVLISVKLDAPWRANWQKGTLATGEPGLDNVLNVYSASSVSSLIVSDTEEVFLVKFDVSLNTRGLVSIFEAASRNIPYVEADGYIGDGDEITFEQVGSQKKYVLSHGWGDCPAGCINRHFWTFTVASDGSIIMQESGDAIPPDGGRKAASPRPTRASLRKRP